MIRKILAVCTLFCIGLQAQESIQNFSSTITINTDSTLHVQEDIRVQAEGRAIRRGIFRDFPTQYRDHCGYNHVVSFKVEKVLLDGKPVDYTVSSYQNGMRVRIGSSNKYLTPGTHTYTVSYTTDHQMGFFDTHDELYWNVTGNGWQFPINRVFAKIIFPKTLRKDSIRYAAYTGYNLSRDNDYQLVSCDGKSIAFSTTKPLNAYQGLTIVIGIPKGVVEQPSFWAYWWWFAKHNIEIVLIVLLVFLFLLWTALILIRRYKQENDLIIIPRYHAPSGMSPGLMRYVINRGSFDEKAFCAEVVQSAVEGLLTIKHEVPAGLRSYLPSWMPVDGIYTLINIRPKGLEQKGFTDKLHKNLFAHNKNSVKLTKDAQSTLESAGKNLEKLYQKSALDFFEKPGQIYEKMLNFFLTNHLAKIVFAFYSVCCLAFIIYFRSPVLNVVPQFIMLIMLPFFVLLVLAIPMVAFRRYSSKGLDILAEIKGFKMFLEATEKERMELVGTPPTQTPQLYEKYLPYAIALGVEEQWNEQFASQFVLWEKQGIVYIPSWYRGKGIGYRSFGSMSSSLSQGMSSAISSSGYAPGSRSGFGGGGRSGGGGGGGGGGGW